MPQPHKKKFYHMRVRARNQAAVLTQNDKFYIGKKDLLFIRQNENKQRNVQQRMFLIPYRCRELINKRKKKKIVIIKTQVRRTLRTGGPKTEHRRAVPQQSSKKR
jgi:hypothetical protein